MSHSRLLVSAVPVCGVSLWTIDAPLLMRSPPLEDSWPVQKTNYLSGNWYMSHWLFSHFIICTRIPFIYLYMYIVHTSQAINGYKNKDGCRSQEKVHSCLTSTPTVILLLISGQVKPHITHYIQGAFNWPLSTAILNIAHSMYSDRILWSLRGGQPSVSWCPVQVYWWWHLPQPGPVSHASALSVESPLCSLSTVTHQMWLAQCW